MNVLYDFQTFYYQNFGGISKCFSELISHLPDDVRAIIGIKESDNVYLKELNLVPNLKPLHWSRDHFILPFYFKGQGKLLNICNKMEFLNTPYTVNKRYSIQLLKEKKFDVFHPTYFDDYYLPYLGDKPFVLTIHDMIPELFFDKNNYQCRKKRLLVKRASHIVAVSENTKRDIINIFKLPEEKISVVYHAVNTSLVNYVNDISNQIDLPSEYFLYVGLRDGYKSFRDFIIQAAPFFHKHKNTYLICTGKPFNKQEWQLILSLHLEKQISVRFLSSSQLMYVYSKAIAFVYPSKYEGFGIPILEAFAMKCPVLLNRASCFPEIAQDASLYFDLDKSGISCLDALENIYSLSNDDREKLIFRGLKRLNDFSWEKSVENLINVYKKII